MDENQNPIPQQDPNAEQVPTPETGEVKPEGATPETPSEETPQM